MGRNVEALRMMTESVRYVEDVWRRIRGALVLAVAFTGSIKICTHASLRNGRTTSVAPRPVLDCNADIN